MKAILVFSILVAIAAANRWDTVYRNDRQELNDRDAKHQKFILDLLRHLKDDLRGDDFMQYSNTIRVDDKNNYMDMDKVYYLVTLLRNGWFVNRGMPFSLFRDRNIITTKALFDFFDTMNDWNTCAINLIWTRRHINEYQFWHLMTLLVTHNRHFTNLMLPSYYEVFPTQFFTGDVINKANMLDVTFDTDKKLVVMMNYTTGVLGSFDDDDNDFVYDLDDVKTDMLRIRDWDTLKKVVYDIKDDLNRGDIRRTMNTRRMNKDIKTKVFNNDRFMKNGLKFDNNGEDRMVYFTEDIGLNNFYYFTRMDNSRILDKKQMYNNDNDKEVMNMKLGNLRTKDEFKDKINRRGERYVYEMKQLLARYNLERKVNGLDVVKDINLDGVIDNGVFTNLRYTNGLQMPNRVNEFHIKKEHTTKLIRMTKDFEDRFYKAIDMGFIETTDGRKIMLDRKDGINIIGNLLQGNRDSLNTNYYRYLEYYYRLLFGGNHNDFVDFHDNRFLPTVLDHHETSMRDSVFWNIMKKITNVVDKYKNKLVGYKTDDVDFDGVRIKDVKIDRLMTKFTYFDVDLTNALEFDKKRICNKDTDDNKSMSDDNDDRSNGQSDESRMDSNESFDKRDNMFENKCKGRDCFKLVKKCRDLGCDVRCKGRNCDNLIRKCKDMGCDIDRMMDFDRKVMTDRTSKQVDYFRRTGINNDMDNYRDTVIGRTRRLDTKKFTITFNVDSKKNTDGIIRIFLGPRVVNKMQLDDMRDHFFELDQFIVKLDQGLNTIRRQSVDFKNVVDDPETMKTLYLRTLNFLNKKTGGNDLKNLNFDTINNNKGFPHRLLLPKGSVGGEDFTMFFIISDLKNDDTQFRFVDMMDSNMFRYNFNNMKDFDRFDNMKDFDRFDNKDDRFNNDKFDDKITREHFTMLKNKFGLQDRDLDMLKDRLDDIVMRKDIDWLKRMFDMTDKHFDMLKDTFGDRVFFRHVLRFVFDRNMRDVDTGNFQGRFDNRQGDMITMKLMVLKNKFGLSDNDLDMLKDRFNDIVTMKDLDWIKRKFDLTDNHLDILKDIFGDRVTFKHVVKFVFLMKGIDTNDRVTMKHLIVLKRRFNFDDKDLDMLKLKIDGLITTKDFDWINRLFDFKDKHFDILKDIVGEKVMGKDLIKFIFLIKNIDSDVQTGRFTDDSFIVKMLMTLKDKLNLTDRDYGMLVEKLNDVVKMKDFDWIKRMFDMRDRDFDILNGIFGDRVMFKHLVKFVYMTKDLDNQFFWDIMDMLKRTTDLTDKNFDMLKNKLDDVVTTKDFDWIKRMFNLKDKHFDMLKDIVGDRVCFKHVIKFVFLLTDNDTFGNRDNMMVGNDDDFNRKFRNTRINSDKITKEHFTMLKNKFGLKDRDLDMLKDRLDDIVMRKDIDWLKRMFGMTDKHFDMLKDTFGDRVFFRHVLRFVFDRNMRDVDTGNFQGRFDGKITMKHLIMLKNKFGLQDRDLDMLKDRLDDVVMRKDIDWLKRMFDMRDRDFDILKNIFGDRVFFKHVIKFIIDRKVKDFGRFNENFSDSRSMSDDSNSMSDSDSNESMDVMRMNTRQGNSDRRDYKNVMIHNFNNGNMNIGNGNGILDNRVMGFPLDRRIIDVNGFITRNMFFKDVKIYHIDTTTNKKWDDGKWDDNRM